MRKDKKFQVKLYIEPHNKLIFQHRCLKYHLSMMFASSTYVSNMIRNSSESQIREAIEEYLPHFHMIQKNNLHHISARFLDEDWQVLGGYAIDYQESIAKIASSIFKAGISSIEMARVFEENGLLFKYQKTMVERKKTND